MLRQRLLLSNNNSGFTLVELSIAIVIIGLIVGSVLVGRDLISAAEIRSQISQIEKYQTAVNTFRAKYGAFPGDIKNADAIAFGFVARGTTRGRGDGDGVLEGSWSSDSASGIYFTCGETGLFWRDLSVANLIDGSFTTATYAEGVAPCNIAVEGAAKNLYFPQAKIGNNSYVYVWSGGWAPINAFQDIVPSDKTNYFAISRIEDANQGQVSSSITPNQAYAIDSKIDDGLPQFGRVLAMYANAESRELSWTVKSHWAAGGKVWPGMGNYQGGNCDHSNNCGPVTASASPVISSDAQASNDYDNDWIDCFDNRNIANAVMQYSIQYMGGTNPSCALSFKF